MNVDTATRPGERIASRGGVSIHRWSEDDLPVLRRANTAEMTAFLGGPEPEEKVLDRHERYLRYWQNGEARMFTIRVDEAAEPVGSVGYWETVWHDEPVYEAGWGIATGYQGRGVASLALAACLGDAATHGDRRAVLAFPRVDNAASNALCRAVGFVCAGEEGFEYPKGHPIRVNAWVYQLRDGAGIAGG
ncbi:GNAT family N-acetyltransferase [Leifsonia sp. NPDC102414]|uniref:GNAT family N-acetyltransferase n=1 Tax=Leifsonia sp. NPDC102414 TaxID=3364124 RepID=UPI003827D4AA